MMTRTGAAALLLLVALAAHATGSVAAPLVNKPAPEPAKPAPAEVKPPPGTIPIPEVARQADEVAKLLREYDDLLAPAAAAVAEKRLPGVVARMVTQITETERQLASGQSTATLDSLTTQWQATRVELVGYVNTLAQRATLIEEALDLLTDLRETWIQTRTHARTSGAPAQVVARIDGVIRAMDSTRSRLQEQRAAILVLQDQVAREVAQCETMLKRIAEVRLASTGGLFDRDSVPLWRADQLSEAVAAMPERMRNAGAADGAQLQQFVRDQRWKIPVQVLLFGILLLLIRAGRRRVHLWSAPGEQPPATAPVFDRSVSAAMLFALLASLWIYTPPLPRIALAILQILILVPALRIMRLLVPAPLVPTLYILGGFFVLDIIRHLASVVPALEQQLLLLEMLAGIAMLTWWARRWRSAAVPPPAPVVRLTAWIVLGVFVVAFAAAVSGYMKLALLLGAGVLGSGYLAAVLYAGLRVGDGLAAFALRDRPLRHLRGVKHHRELLERRIHTIFCWLAAGAWAYFALRYFGLWNSAKTTAENVLAASWSRGAVNISVADVLTFVITVGAAFAVSSFIRFVLAEDVFPHLRLGRGLAEAFSGVLYYSLVLVGVLAALAMLGIDLTKITIVAGALGVGVGLGLQGVVNNFVSGAIVLFERKINVGDAVQIGDVAGQVQQMGMRACTVRTWDGAEVIVPNAILTTEKVTNWTLSDSRRRVDVVVGVAYGTPPEKALEVLRAVAAAHPLALTNPPPQALFRGFGDSALQVELRVWTDRYDLSLQMHSELAVAVYAALREAGIEIPFPQREIRVRQS